MRLGLALLVLLAGCGIFERPPEVKAINAYLADSRDLSTVRRIMVLPFTESPGVRAETSRVREAYLSELAKLRRFEIVPLPHNAEEDDVLNRGMTRGRLSTESIVSLCERYNLDGVLVGTVTNYRAYKPPHLGLRTQMVSVHSGHTVWAVDALYDASDASTISDLRHYASTFQAKEGSLHGWEMNLIAPTRFASYVSHRVVGTWRED